MSFVRRGKVPRMSPYSQRIFLCLARENIPRADRLIADRLLSAIPSADFVVTYLDASSPPDADTLRTELDGCSVLIVWVTRELLDSRKTTGDWPAEYRTAREISLPIIPFVEDESLFPEFTELSGAIHGIGMSERESSVKYYRQLRSILYGEHTMSAIRAKAFRAEIFLSYRKANAREARHFMRRLHDVEGLESVCVWYDDFLTAGRSFDDEIKNSIEKCGLFVLLVTPELATEGNYVQRIEYPYACKAGKIIVPIEAVPTEISRFEACYPGAGEPVPIEDGARIRDLIASKLGIDLSEPTSSERAYFLGLSYLNGLGVERDRERAFRLLGFSSEHEDAAAMYSCMVLANRLEGGFALNTDYAEAIKYRLRGVELSRRILGTDHPDTVLACYSLAESYLGAGDTGQAAEWSRKASAACEETFGSGHENTAAAYSLAGRVLIGEGEYESALDSLKKALSIDERRLGADHPHAASDCANLSTALLYLGRFDEAEAYAVRALTVYEERYGPFDRRTAAVYRNLGGIRAERGDFREALRWHDKALQSQKRMFGTEDHRECAVTYNALSVAYRGIRRNRRAMEAVSKAYSICVRTLGMSHPDTVATLESLNRIRSVLRTEKRWKIGIGVCCAALAAAVVWALACTA